MNEESPSTTGWRDQAPSHELRAKVLGRVQHRTHRTRFRLLAVGLVGSGALMGVLSIGALLGSAPMTLAQVIHADENADSITIVNRRIMGSPSKETLSLVTKAAGDVVRCEVIRSGTPNNPDVIQYVDNTDTVVYTPRYQLAVYDDSHKRYGSQIKRPKVSELLKDFKAATVTPNVDWNGRKLTRFAYKASLRNTDIDQQLLVDPKTNLPVNLISKRDKGSWGDEWTYDYSHLDPAALKPDLPRGTKVVDNRKIRPQMVAWTKVSKAAVAFSELSPYQLCIVIVRSVLPRNQFSIPFTVCVKLKSGTVKTLRGEFVPRMSGGLAIGDKEFAPLMVLQDGVNPLDDIYGDGVNGTLTIGGKTYTFSGIPMVKTGELSLFNAPFSEAYNERHPEDQYPTHVKGRP